MNPKILTKANKRFASTSKLLLHLDEFALKIGEIIQTKNITISSGFQDVAFAATFKYPNDLFINGYENSNRYLTLNITQGKATNVSALASLYSGSESFIGNEEILVYSFLYGKNILLR